MAGKNNKDPKPKNKISTAFFLGMTFIFCVLVFFGNKGAQMRAPENISYPKFVEYMDAQQIVSAEYTFGNYYFTITLNDEAKTRLVVPAPDDLAFKEKLMLANIEVVPKPQASTTMYTILSLLPQLVFITIIIIYGTYLFKMMHNSGDVGNSQPVDAPNITFADVAGNREQKKQMQDLLHFLRTPGKYARMGAKLPKGVLFLGPPGTGKTLMAKALAGEAGVPFFSASGSEFVEMFVGRGASRIRALFKRAREHAPCVIFIDEIDAIGKREQGGSGGNSEYVQTINELLAQMDGFNAADGVLVIGATNRADDIDIALLRSGRFGEHITIGLPDREARIELLHLYFKDKELSAEVSLEGLSTILVGCSGADIAELANRAAIIAINEDAPAITQMIIDRAMVHLVTKGVESEQQRSPEEDKLIAFHETGHAVLTKLLTDHMVYRVSIIPTTSGAGGYTIHAEEKEFLHSRKDLLHQIIILYGGRAAEEIYFQNADKITTGASNDIREATRLINKMITTYGMSDYGLLNPAELSVELTSNTLQEAQKLASQCYTQAKEVLEQNWEVVETVAAELQSQKSLTDVQLSKVMQLDKELCSLQHI